MAGGRWIRPPAVQGDTGQNHPSVDGLGQLTPGQIGVENHLDEQDCRKFAWTEPAHEQLGVGATPKTQDRSRTTPKADAGSRTSPALAPDDDVAMAPGVDHMAFALRREVSNRM